ncbi:restriction endonuclease subunit S [Campylobacter lanienae]|uniref:restriction endonuclease subunit S n=1 Tax=Campylobacter lanienae TaxID=75658 RepID=UPI000BB40286|nr:restriction endonuclease subunit S [Campylobacter lanienae]
MSKLEELINKLCPNGVEFKTLQYLCGTITTGKLNANAMEDDGLYPFFTCDSNPFKINTYAFDEEAILISGNGSQVGHINYYKGKFNAYQRTYVIYDFKEINAKFLLHYLNGYLKEYILKNCKKGSIPYITLPMLQKFCIPVPPLEVQCEIVRILDNFTLLSTELSIELKARQQQYKYYRDILLSFNEIVPRKKLIDISNISRGKRVTKKDLDDSSEYPVYQNSLALMGYYNDYNYEENKTYVISAGAAGEIGFCKEKFWAADDCLVIYNLKDILDKYVYYYLLSKQDYIKANVRKASIPRLSRTIIENIEIPIPSIERQEEIVYILDRLDKLCNDITSGIPAEIEKRQKQYEHYRDKLLTFKELKS